MSARILLAALACAVTLAACSDETVVLANIPSDDAGAPLNLPVRCVAPGDCSDGVTYCDKATCGAAAGTCSLFPGECTNTEAAVCGCDGVTYFNDCLRQAAGVAAGTPGPCPIENGVQCAGPSQKTCPSGASCAVLLGSNPGPMCPRDAPGTCWVLPASCPATSATGDFWDDCDPDGPQCEETCAAIRNGSGEYRRAQQCPP